MVAQADEIPETVLITGSLIRGTAAVGVPVTNLSPMDFAMSGALTTADLFRTFPAANVAPGPVATMSGANIERGTKVNLRGLDTGNATRSLMMIDGMRFPGQGNGQCVIDPSIIPALSMDHIDVLVDGASATYGSDAVGGVINIILKRNMDGAITQVRWTTTEGGKNRYLASAVWGRTWDGGQITLSYEWNNESPDAGEFPFQVRHRPLAVGLRRPAPLGSSLPADPLGRRPASQSGRRHKSARLPTAAMAASTAMLFRSAPARTGMPARSGVGPLLPGSAATLNWADFTSNGGNSGTNGLRNQFDPFKIAWYDARQERNGGHITVDQRLTSNISFYGSGFYSNRRGHFVNPSNLSPSATNILSGPPFRPSIRTTRRAGRPVAARCAPTIISAGKAPASPRSTSWPSATNWASTSRFPASGAAASGTAQTQDAELQSRQRAPSNKNAVSAALGWTIGTIAAGRLHAGDRVRGQSPRTFPISNLVCDPLAYQCNSPNTLAYVQGIRNFTSGFGSMKRACSSTARCSIFRAARSRPRSARPTPASSCRPPCSTTPAPPA